MNRRTFLQKFGLEILAVLGMGAITTEWWLGRLARKFKRRLNELTEYALEGVKEEKESTQTETITLGGRVRARILLRGDSNWEQLIQFRKMMAGTGSKDIKNGLFLIQYLPPKGYGVNSPVKGDVRAVAYRLAKEFGIPTADPFARPLAWNVAQSILETPGLPFTRKEFLRYAVNRQAGNILQGARGRLRDESLYREAVRTIFSYQGWAEGEMGDELDQVVEDLAKTGVDDELSMRIGLYLAGELPKVTAAQVAETLKRVKPRQAYIVMMKDAPEVDYGRIKDAIGAGAGRESN